MYSFGARPVHLCQEVSRREWLRVGGLSSMGLMLPSLLRSEQNATERGGSFGRAKSCIVCFLFGGPAHQDMWDLKPDGPAEVRGPFQPIRTSVPGTWIGEHLPRTAQRAHQFALIRSVTHPDSTHTVAMHYMQTGVRHRRPNTNPTNLPDDFPCFGAMMNRLNAQPSALPAGISLNSPGNEIPSGHIFPGFFAGFLGRSFDPLFVTEDPSRPDFHPFPLTAGLAAGQVEDRKSLLDRLDHLRRGLDHVAAVRNATSFQAEAIRLLRSPEAMRAFDLSRESPALREQYGMTPFGQGCLLSRRLVEAGVRLVTVNWARDYQAGVADHWDTHADNFGKHQQLLPAFDAAYATLLDDLQQRGLLDETLVAVIAEFGRTPKINKNAGRDHWPGCFSITLAGAGIQGGLVHGASDSMAAYPARDPVSPEQVAATLYHALGVASDTEIVDHSGRPFPLVTGKPLLPCFG